VKHWPQGSPRERFEQTAGEAARAEDLFEQLLPSADPAEFSDQAETNLRAGVLRLVFVADHIPDTLRRIIEFLNQQTDRGGHWG